LIQYDTKLRNDGTAGVPLLAEEEDTEEDDTAKITGVPLALEEDVALPE
jgi:hypothetical protein